jgi:hypothetical protein
LIVRTITEHPTAPWLSRTSISLLAPREAASLGQDAFYAIVLRRRLHCPE